MNQQTIINILKKGTSNEILDLIRAQNTSNIHYIEDAIVQVVRTGNYKLAGNLIAEANKRSGYGFNFLHEEVLLKDSPEQLTDFKKQSVTKKAMSNFQITPIHCAAINPNPDILKRLLESKPEYSIMDYQMRKPVHYAACCESDGTLKLLISKGVDIREGDRKKLTPLMLAAKNGRVHNVQLLLGLVEEELERKTLLTVKSREG